MLEIKPAFDVYPDTDGQPLNAGYIYIGSKGSNPETNTISVWWDSALTIPAAQPIRTVNGFASNNGRPGNLYTGESNYSITVRNSNSSLVYSKLNVNAIDKFRIDYPVSVSSSSSQNYIIGPNGVLTASGLINLSGNIFIEPGGELVIDDLVNISSDITNHGTFTINAIITPSGAIINHGDIAVNANTNFSGNVSCPGGVFSGASDPTFSGSFEAPIYHVFTGSGAVSITGDVSEIYPEWFGAVGDGVTNDATALQSALTNAANKTLVLSQDYVTTTELTGVSNTIVRGNNGIIRTATADITLLSFTSQTDFLIESVKFISVVSTVYKYGVLVSGGSHGTIRNCEFEGMSGDGVRVTSGAFYITVEDNHFHDFTGSIQDSSDINFYNSASFCTAVNNKCFGGNWHGIKLQLTSTEHTVRGNAVGAHTAYGIILYDTTARDAKTIISDNIIQDISGDALISGQNRAGAGIYCVSCGGVTIANNYIRNTNVNTTVEVLTPGGIGLSGPYSPCKIIGNTIESANWYSIAVFSSTENVTVANNTINDGTLTQIYVKNSDNVTVVNNTLSWITAVRGIFINDDTTTSNNIAVNNNTVIGDGVAAQTGIEIKDIDTFVCNSNLVQNVVTRGIQINSSDNGVVNGNTVNTNTTGLALRYSACTEVAADGNFLVSTGTYAFESAGTCTNSYVRGGYISSSIVNNAGTGCNVEVRRSSVPGSGNWQIGDKTWHTTPTVDGNNMVLDHWVCTVAGSPGTHTPQYISSVSPAT